ncbi:MAG: hypothetical protein NUV91_04050, partial [Candidatus Omnitrophica bacterium]|nr:hypothetical protein [Candidatus Omnitrophota bacterium]
LWRLSTRWIWLIGGVFAALLLITLVGNIVLSFQKEPLLKSLNQHLSHEVKVGQVSYFFPSWLLIQDAAIQDDQVLDANNQIKISSILLKISLQKSFKKHQLLIDKIVFSKVESSQGYLQSFLHEHSSQIMTFIENLPQEDVQIEGQEIRLLENMKEEKKNILQGDFFMRRRGNHLEGKGAFAYGEVSKKLDNPLSFQFAGNYDAKGFRFDRFELLHPLFCTDFWGQFKKDQLEFRGYVFTRRPSSRPGKEKFVIANSIPRNIKKLKKFWQSKIVDLYVLDIDGLVSFSFPQILLNKLHFTVNNVPFRIRGAVDLKLPLSFAFNVISRWDESSEGKPRALDLRLKGVLEERFLSVNGEGQILYLAQKETNIPLEKISFQFSPLQIGLESSGKSSFHLEKGKISFWTNGNEHRLTLDGLKALLNMQGPLALLNVQGPFYEGKLQAKIWVETQYLPMRMNSRVTVEDVPAFKLEELLVHFAKVNGKLSSEFYLQNYPDIELKGTIGVKTGRLSNYDFFNWLGATLGIENLKEMDFQDISSKFFVDRRGAGLDFIHIDAHDLGVDGYFYVDKNSLVSSQLSLIFGRDLLKKSLRFRPILGMFEKDVSSLEFKFQLSGNFHQMNFQWLPSESKKRIQERIPDFIERIIESRIDSMIQPEKEKEKVDVDKKEEN